MDRENLEIIVETENKIRIDRYISELNILSRNQIKERNLVITLNGKVLKPSAKAQNGKKYLLEWDKEVEVNIEPENIPLNIIFEDSNCVVINKEQGMVVHPSIGNYTGTLVQALMYHIKNLSDNFNGDFMRPGIVHRLDKDTSGVIICAKNSSSLEFLANQFKNRTNTKEYLAIVKGVPGKKRDTISNYITRDDRDRKKFISTEDTGKYSETDYVVLGSSENYSILKLTLKTGRTHQIRVHMKHIGHPILGDPIYSRPDGKYKEETLMLHAFHLGINIPETEEYMDFYSNIPQRMLKILESENIEIPTSLTEYID